MRWLLQPNDDRFAHPAEIEVARLLTFYGLRWAYEPTTFAVRWGRDGRPVEFVTPDFYLPEHDLYLELTTMRQRLVTRARRQWSRKGRESVAESVGGVGQRLGDLYDQSGVVQQGILPLFRSKPTSAKTAQEPGKKLLFLFLTTFD